MHGLKVLLSIIITMILMWIYVFIIELGLEFFTLGFDDYLAYEILLMWIFALGFMIKITPIIFNKMLDFVEF